ncbi:hypothetical protein AAUPMC_11306, partial [Pasteurella multocida subsp. multocida str. Anand1_cattle]
MKLIDPTESYSSYAGTKYDLENGKALGTSYFRFAFLFYIGYRIIAL